MMAALLEYSYNGIEHTFLFWVSKLEFWVICDFMKNIFAWTIDESFSIALLFSFCARGTSTNMSRCKIWIVKTICRWRVGSCWTLLHILPSNSEVKMKIQCSRSWPRNQCLWILISWAPGHNVEEINALVQTIFGN